MALRFQSPEGVVLTVQLPTDPPSPSGIFKFQSPEGVVLTVQRLMRTRSGV